MLKFFNAFGIVPSKNYEAAGWDWYVPNIDRDSDKLRIDKYVRPALCKGYGITDEQIDQLMKIMGNIINDHYYFDEDDTKFTQRSKEIRECYNANKYNSLLLYLAFSFKSNNRLFNIDGEPALYNMNMFIYNNLLFDVNNNTVGVELERGNTLFINTGVKEKVPTGYAGVFLNKSGRGSSGYDVRAQVVDEDYTGYVHINVQFLGQKSSESRIYCGDKLVQQLVLPLYKESEDDGECSEEEFNSLTAKSQRGEQGFGSSNEKH